MKAYLHYFSVSTLICALFLSLSLPLQGRREQGKPFIHNYTPKNYNAHTQNWAVVQDYKGIMYFGNTYGVLQYDGISWDLLHLPNHSTVRSLGIDQSGKRIYVGGVGEFGYLEADSLGKMRYHSLSDSLTSQVGTFSNVWSVHVPKDGEAYFQTSEYLFHYAFEGLEAIPLNNAYHRSFMVHGDIYLRQDSLGLGKFGWGEWKPIEGGELFAKEPISGMVPLQDERVIIGTRSKGLFIMSYDLDTKESQIEPFPCPASDWLKKNPLYHATRMPSGSLVFASLSGGVIITDESGNIRQQLNVGNGLRNNKTYYVYAGKDKALWVAMNNGIAHAEINSPLTRWDRQSGLAGSIYDVTRYKGNLYAASSNGIFRLDENTEGDYEFIPMLSENIQVWQLVRSPATGTLIAASSDGLWELQENRKWRRISQEHIGNGSCFSILFPSKNPKRLVVGMLNGLAILEWENNRWQWMGKPKGLSQQIRNIVEDARGDLWLSTRYKGVIRLKLGADGATEESDQYSEQQGLPASFRPYATNISGEILIGTPEGLVRFDSQTQAFLPDSRFGEKFTRQKYGIRNMAEDKNGNVWIHAVEEKDHREWLEVASPQINGTYQLDSVTLKRLTEVEMYCIYPDLGNITWIGSSDGLFRYDNRIYIQEDASFHAIIRKVVVPEDSILFYGNYPLAYSLVGKDRYMQDPPPQQPQIPNERNSITFHFAAPSFENEANTRFSYRLKGHEENWSEWTHATRHSYFDLPPGSYTFYVKAHNIYDQESTIAKFKFSVLPAWYQRPAVWVLMLLGFFGFLAGLAHWYARRVNRAKRRLEQVVWARTKEVREQKDEIEQINQELEMQKEELAVQRDRLANSVADMERLGNIGVEVASTLSIPSLVQRAYHHIYGLLDFASFGIGFFNQDTQKIEFPDAVAHDKPIPKFEYSLSDKEFLAVYCFSTKQEIIIHDYQKEKEQYLNEDGEPMLAGKDMRSLIYLPLLVKNKPVGILTIQHQSPNYFDDYHIGLLRNLAVYLAVAVEHAESYHLMEMQKQQIEQKSQEVQYSINYAKRIQRAILPEIGEIHRHLPESFVFLKPRNVVSGDFHWFATKRDALGNLLLIIAAVDCTGHGVPGAFMSMIGHELLREIVGVMGVVQPDKILNRLHVMIREELHQEETGNRDGMDISLCVLDFSRAKIEFAGAKNSLVYVHKNEIYEIPGDNQSIGGIQREEERVFTKHTVMLDPEEETAFYLFSDGFQDQFGGKRRRKFTSRRFRSFLQSIHDKPINQQEDLLRQTLKDWMGDAAQVDDILVLGFRA